MTSKNVTVAEIVQEMLEKAKDKRTDSGAWLRSESVGLMLEEYANAVNAANKREVAELERRYADACRCCDDAERRLKVAEDALASAWMYADKLPRIRHAPSAAEMRKRVEELHSNPYGISDDDYNYILRGDAGKKGDE